MTLTVKNSEAKPEGRSRPHFFHGVATIVMKLLNIVKPSIAFFGQKDAQQCSTIKQLVSSLNIDCEVVVCDTTREADGLAMSTRNNYLSPEERRAAPVIYKSLLTAKKLINQGQHDVEVLRQVCCIMFCFGCFVATLAFVRFRPLNKAWPLSPYLRQPMWLLMTTIPWRRSLKSGPVYTKTESAFRLLATLAKLVSSTTSLSKSIIIDMCQIPFCSFFFLLSHMLFCLSFSPRYPFFLERKCRCCQ